MHLQINDLADMLFGELVEDDDLINTVQKFRAESPFQVALDLALAFFLVERAVISTPETYPFCVFYQLSADIRRHNEDGVAEVYRVALTVGQPPVLQDLEQAVPDVWMCFFNFVEEDYLIGTSPHSFGKLPPFLVADIARRRAGHT